MPTPKKLPAMVVEKARALALRGQYRLAPAAAAKAPAPAPASTRPAREKVVQALRRLHPMD